MIDPDTGKATTKLTFEDKKKPASKFSHTVRDTPANAVVGKLHQEIRETEQDNVGVESAHKSEETAEAGVRLVREGYHSHKLKPYRKAAEAERKLEKLMSMLCIRSPCRKIPNSPAIPYPAGSKSKQSKKSMPLRNTQVRLLGIPLKRRGKLARQLRQ